MKRGEESPANGAAIAHARGYFAVLAAQDDTQSGRRSLIARFPSDVQEILEKIRRTIRKAAPAADETIKYQMPTFTLNGNLVHFAAFKKHIGFYPAPRGIVKFKDELSAYEGAKSSND